MTEQEFNTLSNNLRQLALTIPLNWGHIQNNRTDDKINMFQILSYEELEKSIARLNDDQKNYLRRRWFLWKCSACDEYLFYCNDNVEKNPDPRDKEYDVIINDRWKFDIKGTVIPKNMRDNADVVITNPERMIQFFYDEQSKGRRYDMQNRLFIVHHSFVQPERELYLRCTWDSKKNIYKQYIENIDNISLMDYKGVKASVIFILEREKGKVEYRIFGL